MDGVKVFHARAAVTQNTQSPIVECTVRGTISWDVNAECNRCQKATLLIRLSWTARYDDMRKTNEPRIAKRKVSREMQITAEKKWQKSEKTHQLTAITEHITCFKFWNNLNPRLNTNKNTDYVVRRQWNTYCDIELEHHFCRAQTLVLCGCQASESVQHS